MDTLKIDYDQRNDTVTIEGVTYAGIVFRELGKFMPLGQLFRLVNREDGVVTIERVKETE